MPVSHNPITYTVTLPDGVGEKFVGFPTKPIACAVAVYKPATEARTREITSTVDGHVFTVTQMPFAGGWRVLSHHYTDAAGQAALRRAARKYDQALLIPTVETDRTVCACSGCQRD